MLRRFESFENGEFHSAKELALLLFATATLRSGSMLQNTADYAYRVEKLLLQTLGGLGVSNHEQIEEEYQPESDAADGDEQTHEEHDEL